MKIRAGLAALLLAWLVPLRAADCPPPLPELNPEVMERVHYEAQDRGLLWRLTRDGRESWLFGTLHVGRLAWAAPGPAVREALRGSDLIALEIDVLEPRTSQALQVALAAAPTATPPPALQQRLARLVERACLPPKTSEQMPALMLALQLSLLEARREGLEPFFAQEIILGMAARASRKPVVSLETVEGQVSALVPKDREALLRDIDRALALIERGQARGMMRRLAQAWADGDLETLAAYEQWCDCIVDEHDRASFARLNDQRNPHLARRIAELHGDGQRVFAAVGALHMTGPLALPRLLADAGFRVERVVQGSPPTVPSQR